MASNFLIPSSRRLLLNTTRQSLALNSCRASSTIPPPSAGSLEDLLNTFNQPTPEQPAASSSSSSSFISPSSSLSARSNERPSYEAYLNAAPEETYTSTPYDPAEFIPPPIDPLASLSVNLLMKDGKKLRAVAMFHEMLDYIHEKTGEDAYPIYRQAVLDCAPALKFTRHVKGIKTTIIPIPASERYRISRSIRWILEYGIKRKEPRLSTRYAEEILAVRNGTSEILKLKDMQHKLALTNRANLPRSS